MAHNLNSAALLTGGRESARELPPIEWQPDDLPSIDMVLVFTGAGVDRRYAVSSAQPSNWPFPALDAIQARNHAACVDSLRRIEQRNRQQRLRECLEAAGEALL